jgi:hypothetical protein
VTLDLRPFTISADTNEPPLSTLLVATGNNPMTIFDERARQLLVRRQRLLRDIAFDAREDAKFSLRNRGRRRSGWSTGQNPRVRRV